MVIFVFVHFLRRGDERALSKVNRVKKGESPGLGETVQVSLLYIVVVELYLVISAESLPPFLLIRLVTIAALLRHYSPSPHRRFTLCSGC
jgi:hypothetical protein